LQRGDERIAPRFDLVFHGKDVLPLAPLFGFGLADVLLQALGVFHAERHARLALQPLELELRVLEGLLSADAMRSSAQASSLSRSCPTAFGASTATAS